MNTKKSLRNQGFTLMETVIAIGIVAVLLTAFLTVMTPAAQGIRRAVNTQEADKLTSALERELITLRETVYTDSALADTPEATTSFEKGFNWLRDSSNPEKAIIAYQYRADLEATLRSDGTPPPLIVAAGQPGSRYTVISMARRTNDANLQQDLEALVGSVFFVRTTQLIFNGTQLEVSTDPDNILNPADGVSLPADLIALTAADYNEAVISFTANFHILPSKSPNYYTSPTFINAVDGDFFTNKKPVFSRNLAIRR